MKDTTDNQKHAEMELLDKVKSWNFTKDAILISSLQPCRMCFGRISFWGSVIKKCYYLKSDPTEILTFDTKYPSDVKGGLLEMEVPNSLEENQMMTEFLLYSKFFD